MLVWKVGLVWNQVLFMFDASLIARRWRFIEGLFFPGRPWHQKRRTCRIWASITTNQWRNVTSPTINTSRATPYQWQDDRSDATTIARKSLIVDLTWSVALALIAIISLTSVHINSPLNRQYDNVVNFHVINWQERVINTMSNRRTRTTDILASHDSKLKKPGLVCFAKAHLKLEYI